MRYFTRCGELEREYRFERRGSTLIAHCGERSHEIDLSLVGDGSAFSLLVDGRSHDVIVERVDGGVVVQLLGQRIEVEVLDDRERAARAVAGARPSGPQEICAVMPGVVVEVLVAEGDVVEAGQTLLVLEAMKMQNPLQADAAGVVKGIKVQKGTAVAGGALLMVIEAAPEA